MLFELLDVFAHPEGYRVTLRDGELLIEPLDPPPSPSDTADGSLAATAAESPSALAFARMPDGFGGRTAL